MKALGVLSCKTETFSDYFSLKSLHRDWKADLFSGP